MSNEPYSHHPNGGSRDQEFCVVLGHFLATPQVTNLARNRLMNASSARSCKVIRDNANPNGFESRKVASK